MAEPPGSAPSPAEEPLATRVQDGAPVAAALLASAPPAAPAAPTPRGCSCFGRRRPSRAAQLAADAALLRAAALGHEITVSAAIEAGACLGSCDKLGDTAMHEAARNGHVSCVEALLGAGAPTSQPNQHGYTPLHYAAHQGKIDVANALLDAGADVAARVHSSGWTPLHWAVSRRKAAVAAAIVRAGGDPLARSAAGETPYDLARDDPAMVAALTPPPRVAFAALVFSLPPVPPARPENGTASALAAARVAHDALLRRRASDVANALRPLPGCAVALLQQPTAEKLAEAVAALTPPQPTLKQLAQQAARQAAQGGAPA